MVLSDAEGPVLAVVVEVQLRRDPAKRWSWPIYLATLRGRFHCPTVLLVVCVDAAVATCEYQSDFARRYYFEGKAEGEAEGKAAAVLTFLDARGIDVPSAARTRITECSDLNQLDSWVRHAVTADSVDDLFD